MGQTSLDVSCKSKSRAYVFLMRINEKNGCNVPYTPTLVPLDRVRVDSAERQPRLANHVLKWSPYCPENV